MTPSRPAVAAGLLGMALLAAARGGRTAEPVTLAGPAMGTTFRVALAAPVAGRSTAMVHREIEAVLGRLDSSLSHWRNDSALSRLNAAPAGAWIALDADLAAVLRAARSVHAASGGAFDPTVLPLVEAWRAGAPDAATVAAARATVGLDTIEWRDEGGTLAARKRSPETRLDLGAIGPGWAVDAIGERLVELGSENHLVSLGGECRAWGTAAGDRAWQVQLDPGGPGHPARVVDLPAGTALATSTRRPGRSPLDPRSGTVAGGGATSVTVRGPSAGLADAWALALLVQSADPGWPERQQRRLPPGYTVERIGAPPAPR